MFDARGRELVASSQDDPVTLCYGPRVSGTYYLNVFNADLDAGGT